MVAEQELIRRVVQPHQSILVVGANTHWKEDPRVAVIGQILAKKEVPRTAKNRFWLLDVQRRIKMKKWSTIRRSVKSQWVRKRLDRLQSEADGLGDPVAHRKSLDELKKFGIRVVKPKIHFASAFQTGFPDESLDVIWDGASSPWATGMDRSKMTKEEWKKRVLSLGEEYFRVGKPGSTIGFILGHFDSELLEHLKTYFTGKKCTCETHPLDEAPFELGNIRQWPKYQFEHALLITKPESTRTLGKKTKIRPT